MHKSLRIYIVVFILLLVALFYYEKNKTRPVNWFPSYVKNHSIPYGTYVLYHALPGLFPKTEIHDVNLSPYVFLKEKKPEGCYLFIDKSVNIDRESLKQLMTFVSKGNSVFIASHDFALDSLGIETKILHQGADESPFFKLYSPGFNRREYTFDRPVNPRIFSKIDTAKVVVLGQAGLVNEGGERTASGANFIRYNHGKGAFYFHSFPEAFTNYQILKSPNEKYAAALLSYLGNPENLYWDRYLKTGKIRITSPMQFILKNKSLKWAYYLLLIGVIIFIFFEGKRKQRSIPIIKPLQNQTLAFTRTIANMFFEKQEHKNIAEQEIRYFLEYIRSHYHLQTTELNSKFQENLSARSGKSLESISKLVRHMENIHIKNTISEADLVKLNKMIEAFKNQ